MGLVAHHAMLGLAAGALGASGLRIAASTGATGLVRLLAAVPLAAALAATEAIGLGFFHLGGSPATLVGAAVLTWIVVRRAVAAPVVGGFDELQAWWADLGPGARVLVGAAAGLWLGWFWFLLRSPAIGFDGVQYHLTEVQAWVDNGRTGSVVPISHELPFGNYPLTNEVLMAWTAGIATSWVAVAAWGPVAMALIGLSVHAGLRALGVDGAVRLLAAASLITLPIAFQQLNDANTDLPAFAWLAVTAALAAASRERPKLIGPALVAAALAVGTKTTVAVPGLAALAAAIWVSRGALRPHLRALAGFAALGVAAGGYWYLRNLLDHGSPLWPFVELPWGDPTPAFLDRFDSSLLEHPRRTLDGNLDLYRDRIGGGLILLAAALALPLLSLLRRAPSRVSEIHPHMRGGSRSPGRWWGFWAGVVALLGTLVWASAPVTGASNVPGFGSVTLSTVRYLLPVLGTAVAAVALSGRGRAPRAMVLATLAIAIAWNVSLDADLGPAHLPPFSTVRSGVLLGVIGALALSMGPIARLGLRPSGLAVLLVLAAIVTAPSADRYVERHGEFNVTFDSPLVRWFTAQPSFEKGRQEIAMVRTTVGPLAGDRLRHRVRLIPAAEGCLAVRRRAEKGWIVLSELALNDLTPVRALSCFDGERPAYEDERFRVFTELPTAPAR